MSKGKINKIKNHTKVKSTARLIIKSYLAQPMGIIMTFVMPSVLTILLPFLFKPIMINPATHQTDMAFVLKSLIPGIICIPPFVLGFMGIPTVYANLKETGILKRLNVAGIKPWHFFLSLVGVFTILTIVSSAWLYILSLMIWQKNAPVPASGLFIIPYILLIVISMIIGITISNISRSQATAFAMGILIFLPTLFLSGILFAKFEGWPKYVSWFIPNTGFLNLFKITWANDTLSFASLSLNNTLLESLTWFNKVGSTIFAFLYPLGIATIATIICIKKFKFE